MRNRTLALAVGTLLLLPACAGDGDDPTPPAVDSETSVSSEDDDHGVVAGAEEVAEPQLRLVAIDRSGATGMLDLLTENATELDAVGAPTAVASDGRYAFATVPDGLAIIDSGAWTWNHGDHNHYYRTEARSVGTVDGRGQATISPGPLSTSGGTGVSFAGSREAVLLDNEALSQGRVEETFRVPMPAAGGVIAPFADGAVVSVRDAAGSVELVGADGRPVDGLRQSCPEASGSITTVVGLVVGCADGALLWTEADDTVEVEKVAYPAGTTAPPATTFEARKHRPTVAGVAGTRGTWLLDTRERSWSLLRSSTPLRQVVAADDAEGHVVALDRRGRVLVFSAEEGRQVGSTRRLVAPGEIGSRLVVDQDRAYLNSGGVVHEIDYADSARVARELTLPVTPAFLAETGR